MTHVTKGLSLRATTDEESLSPGRSLRRWGGVAAVAATAVLAVSGLSARATDDPGGQPGTAGRTSGGSPTAGPAGAGAGATGAPTPDPARHCVWTTDITSEVRPVDDIGRPPLPDSALMMELCGGVWTGTLAWLVPGVDSDVYRQPEAPPTASACSRPGSADAFLPGSRRVPVCGGR
jgi:hypothetical protein